MSNYANWFYNLEDSKLRMLRTTLRHGITPKQLLTFGNDNDEERQKMIDAIEKELASRE